MRLLTKGHAAVAKAASTDETQYMLNGVFLEETKDGLKAVATDRRIMVMVEDKAGAMPPEDFPANTIPADCKNGAQSATIPTTVVLDAVKSLPRRTSLPILQTVAVMLDTVESALVTTDLFSPVVRKARNIDGRFPDYERMIPKGKADFTISFSPNLLGKALQIAKDFGLDNVKMEFTGTLNPVKMTGESRGQILTIVVMPMNAR